MLFNSYAFLFLFLPLALLTFFWGGRYCSQRVALGLLTVLSLGFYAVWNPLYLPLLLLSIGVNFAIGRQLTLCATGSKSNRQAQSKGWLKNRPGTLLCLGLIFNLSLIAYYKYADFLAASLLPNSLYQSLNDMGNGNWSLAQIALPLAISFFTFQQVGYLVDAYKGQAPVYSWGDYSLFVSFFPQLIAGPIVRHTDVIKQFHKPQTFSLSRRNVALGLTGFTLGLAKKVLIADSLSPWVADIFSHAGEVTCLEAWVGAISYTLQLYFDFSGYSDMAIGIGLLFNISLPVNFNSPYKSTSIVEFWRRWHITLSNFLRDYLYIPLGGSRHGNLRRYGNLMMTMLLGGLWHGAGWPFVLWGGLQGAYLCINHGWHWFNQRLAQAKLPMLALSAGVSWLITLVAVIAGWVIFRAQTLADGLTLLKTMAGGNGVSLPGSPTGKLAFLQAAGIKIVSWTSFPYLPVVENSRLLAIGILIGLLLICVVLPNTQQILGQMRLNRRWAVSVGLLSVLCLLSLNQVSEFLYFQF